MTTNLRIEYVKDSADADKLAQHVRTTLGKRVWGWVLSTVCRHDIQICRMRQQIAELERRIAKGAK